MHHIENNPPDVQVSEADIEEMFSFADKVGFSTVR